MSPGDRVIILYDGVDLNAPFHGWATVTERRTMASLTQDYVYVHFDEIPPNNTFGYPPAYVKPLLVIEEFP